MFSQLTDSLESTLKNLRGQGKLTEENVAESLREVRRAFLEADVNFNVTRDFVKAVKKGHGLRSAYLGDSRSADCENHPR